MLRSLIAASAVLATHALAQSPGGVTIINDCTFDVYLRNEPAAGNGVEATQTILKPGKSWSSPYIKLDNGGVSIKLKKNDFDYWSGSPQTQFEYTYTGIENTLWPDLSHVDGNNDGAVFTKWYLDNDNHAACPVTQQAYRYWNDDANGMQAGCNGHVSWTYGLCKNLAEVTSGDDGPDSNDSGSSASAPSYGQASSVAPAPVSSKAPAAPSSVVVMDSDGHVGSGPTTLVTEVVTVMAGPTQTVYIKRHEHHKRASS